MSYEWDSTRYTIVRDGHAYGVRRLPARPDQRFFEAGGYVLTRDDEPLHVIWDTKPRYGDVLRGIEEVTA